MPNIRIKPGIDYVGDGRQGAAPHYFERLAEKYQTPDNSDPAWLRRYFPDETVRRELCHHRNAAYYYFQEAAKLKVRMTTGWHGKRTDARLQSAGGTLARLKNQIGRGAEVKALEREIAQLRSRKRISARLVRHHNETANYHWHRAMFFQIDGRSRLAWDAAEGLRQWLSFAEIGIRCTPDAVKRARRHFRNEHRNGKDYAVYTNILGPTLKSTDADPAGWRFACLSCGRAEIRRDEFPPHLSAEHGVIWEMLSIDPQRREISLKLSGEVVATWREDWSEQGGQKPLANRDRK